MSKLTIQWPDADVEQVEAAKGRLDVARRRLVARSREGILTVLATVFDQWRDPDSKWRQRFMAEFPGPSGFTAETVRQGLDHALANWTGEAFRAAVEGELEPGAGQSSHRVAPFSMTSVALAGAIPMPSLLSSVLPLCVQSPVLVKSASRDRVTPNLLAESIAEVDPELGRCIEVVSFPGSDGESLGRFLAAECVVATGSDETVASVARRIRPSQRFIAYGHKLSLALVGADGYGGSHFEGLADALSLDIALWDQLGCLSPVCVFVVGGAAERAVTDLTDALANALERRESAMPRGEASLEVTAAIRQERDEARMRVAAGAGLRLRESRGTEWTVIGERDAQWRPSPLHRFVRLHPLPDPDSLGEALRPVVRNLSSVALAGFAPGSGELAAISRQLVLMGASRICPAGQLQAPPIDWRHDGHPNVLPLARFTGVEVPLPEDG